MTAHVPRKIYFMVWAALLLLLLATWGFSRFDLQPFNVAIALGIAFAKALLIVLFFMHAKYSSKLVWVMGAAGVVWLIIMLDLTLSDYLTRGSSWSQ